MSVCYGFFTYTENALTPKCFGYSRLVKYSYEATETVDEKTPDNTIVSNGINLNNVKKFHCLGKVAINGSIAQFSGIAMEIIDRPADENIPSRLIQDKRVDLLQRVWIRQKRVLSNVASVEFAKDTIKRSFDVTFNGLKIFKRSLELLKISYKVFFL
jgi:hypothetical protein